MRRDAPSVSGLWVIPPRREDGRLNEPERPRLRRNDFMSFEELLAFHSANGTLAMFLASCSL